MAKSLITFEVDHEKMFDMVAAVEGPDKFGPISQRIASVLMAPRSVSTFEHIGMAVYGIVVTGVEEAPTTAADPETPGPAMEGGRFPRGGRGGS